MDMLAGFVISESLLGLGDSVVLSKIGCESFQDGLENPHGVSGLIIGGSYGYLSVVWDSGKKNYYLHSELELVL